MKEDNPVQFSTPESASTLRKLPSQPFLKEVIAPALVIIAVILAGIGTGWAFSSGETGGGEKKGASVAPGAQVEGGGKIVGLEDAATFRDNAQGVLEKGGIDGEGTHHLVREGGPSQHVYLTSSVVDLDQFLGKKLEVWGETIGAEKAGWLMDVGKVKVLD